MTGVVPQLLYNKVIKHEESACEAQGKNTRAPHGCRGKHIGRKEEE